MQETGVAPVALKTAVRSALAQAAHLPILEARRAAVEALIALRPNLAPPVALALVKRIEAEAAAEPLPGPALALIG
ncbi:MAG: hypothetical protein NXI21_14595 [Alphaproteobacteria bacterium]|nr:hypothetical protein [Alphaproteobacteria bacterium]